MLQFEAEYRRFALKRTNNGGFQEFYRLLQTIHRIPGVDLLLGYADIHGDLLPINNDDNFHKAVSSANPLLRIIIQRRGKKEGFDWQNRWYWRVIVVIEDWLLRNISTQYHRTDQRPVISVEVVYYAAETLAVFKGF